MQLPFITRKTESVPTREYFFALEINHALVKCAIWSVINDKPQVLAVSSAQPWDDRSEGELITAADAALTDAVSHVDPSGKLDMHKVIFGLPTDWVGEDKIVSDRLHLLKALSDKLALQPVGYVVTPEAAVKFLQATEGVPPTAILIGFWPQTLEITLVRLGKIDGTQLVKKSPHLADDVVEGLSRFPQVDMLPSRMLLYNSGIDLEEIKQMLLAHPWQAPQKKLPFLHFPKVEILPSDFTIRAVALAGGSEVAKVEKPETEIQSAQDLGFIADADILTHPRPFEAPLPPLPPLPPAPLPKFKFAYRLPKFSLPPFHLPKFNLSLTLIILITSLLIGGAGLIAAYWFLPKAVVTLFVIPKPLEHEFELVAGSPSLPADSLEVTVSGDKSTPTTGSKLLGDKATGSVIITNNSGSARNLPVGTVITSPSGLKFVLDEVVTVASASGDATNLQAGKVTVKTTASQIGADYNLSAGTVFRVGTYASLETAAKNDTAISGGTSRQAKAVAKADIEKLRTELVDNLKSQAKEQLLQQVGADQTIILESVTLQTVSEEFSRKVDEEADSVSLKDTIRARGLAVSKSQLQTLVDNQIKPKIPAGFSFDTDVSQTFSVIKTDKNTATFKVRVTALLLPQIDTAEVARSIAGKYPDKAKEYLQTLSSVGQIDFLITPKFPSNLATLPRLPQNITISVRALK